MVFTGQAYPLREGDYLHPEHNDLNGWITIVPSTHWGTATSASSVTSTASASSVTEFLTSAGTGLLSERTANTEIEWMVLRKQLIGDPAYESARTPLGVELRRLRAKIVESGQPLLDWDDIEKITSELRGEKR